MRAGSSGGMNSAWTVPCGPGGDCQWGDGSEFSWEGPSESVVARRDHRRRRAREPYELSPEAQSSQRRIRRENERQRSLHMACTLMSVTSLTPDCGPDLLLTKYQRLSQLVRYTAFLEDATSALVRELGVRLNFDFNPVTRYIRRLRYQIQSGAGVADLPGKEAEEVKKLLDTMSAGESEPAAATAVNGWRHRSAATQPAQSPPRAAGTTAPAAASLPR